MSKFECVVCDNTLNLIVKTSEENIYSINTNGEIEFVDNRSVDQKLILECDECGMEYEFNSELLVVEHKPTLRVESINTFKTRAVAEDDLLLK